MRIGPLATGSEITPHLCLSLGTYSTNQERKEQQNRASKAEMRLS
jgi:hypothetical protein